MRSITNSLVVLLTLLTLSFWSSAETLAKVDSADSGQPSTSGSFDQVIDQVVEREHFFVAQMRQMHPLVETYLQNLKTDHDNEVLPASDNYFLGRLDASHGTNERSFMEKADSSKSLLSRITGIYSMKSPSQSFSQMVMLDQDFEKKHYDFNFVRREFLGEVRCLVIDVEPKENAGNGLFLGRIWVEDQDYSIVRFNGAYSTSKGNSYLHFDSWRMNLRAGVWLPAYIYSEESDRKLRGGDGIAHFKAQTRLWNYDPQRLMHSQQEFTQIQVDSIQTVRDQSESTQDGSPIEAVRGWNRQAEENAVERLQKVGLLAPPGEVDKVLETVINNLIITNNLTVSDVRCRVLLTEPLESFTIGHTIVMSRGLLDVLPDEGTLAMMLAHELSHIVLGHRLDTRWAFNDSVLFPDEKTFERLDFTRDKTDEQAADQRALQLLAKSPYKDKLSNSGLFIRALEKRAPQLKHLIRAHLGNSLAGGEMRMSTLLNSAPRLETSRVDQIAALPLGGRVKLDPWSNRVELLKAKPVALLSPSEKMPFEVTPFLPYLTRMQAVAADKVAITPSAR